MPYPLAPPPLQGVCYEASLGKTIIFVKLLRQNCHLQLLLQSVYFGITFAMKPEEHRSCILLLAKTRKWSDDIYLCFWARNFDNPIRLDRPGVTMCEPGGEGVKSLENFMNIIEVGGHKTESK